MPQQQEVETILMQQLAGYLSMPVFLVDPEGNLLFYNEPAEAILGQRFEETGAMPQDEWAKAFTPTDAMGRPIPVEELPLAIALGQRVPAHKKMGITGLDGKRREISVTAFPLCGEGNRMVGAVAMFWENPT